MQKASILIVVKECILCQVNIIAYLVWWDVSLFDVVYSTYKYGVLIKCQLIFKVQKRVVDKADYKGVKKNHSPC